MTFTPRQYPDIVRDLLTTLTGGTVREVLDAPAGADPALALVKLHDRPVRRVSHLEGRTAVGAGADRREIDYRFTAADFELVDGEDAIRFRPDGRRPVPGSTLVVNYYPVQTQPVPLTDLNVGSVTRTLLETVARELAAAHLALEQVYRSAFVETAEGAALDRVVALVGLERLPAGHPLVTVVLERASGEAGRIAVPANTPFVSAGEARYRTIAEVVIEPGESTQRVQAAGEAPGTALVGTGELRLEISLAGVATATTNPEPAHGLATPETDDELRRRARGALHGTVRGTVDALRFALLSLPEVQDAAIVEAPNGVDGEIRVDVAYRSETPAAHAAVQRVIDDYRAAGVRARPAAAQRRRVGVRVEATLAGASLPEPAALAALGAGVRDRLTAHLAGLAPGARIRRARLSALVLEDTAVLDARVVLIDEDGTESEELALDAGQVVDVAGVELRANAADEPAAAVTATVSAALPLHLVPGVSRGDAVSALTLALTAFLKTVRPDLPLTVDRLLAAVRDDTRYAIVRSDVIVTVEAAGRFIQLTDGVGEYAPAAGEMLASGPLDLQVREGGV